MYKANLGVTDFAGDFGGSLNNLVKTCLGTSLKNHVGATTEEMVDKRFFNENHGIKGNVDFQDDEKKKVFMYEGKVQYDFTKDAQAFAYVKSRFLTKEFREAFEIGYTHHMRIYRAPVHMSNFIKEGTLYQNRICIPIYLNGELVSMEGRDYTRKQFAKVIYHKGSNNSHLFNIDNLKKDEPLIVVEGIMDMARIWTHITKNVTTTYGTKVSGFQQQELKEFDKVILFSDADTSGEGMISKFYRFMEKPFWVATLDSGDPGDAFNTLPMIEHSINQAKEVTEFFLDGSGLFENIADKVNAGFLKE